MEPITPAVRRPRLRRALIGAVALAGLAAGGWLAYGHLTEEAPVTFTTSEASRGDVVTAVTASGTLSPVIQVDVGSQVSGRLAEVLVDYNDHVEAGQVIARLDPEVFESAVSQAQARLGSAKAELTRARAVARNATAQHTRTVGLVEVGVVAAADVDTALADARSAESQVIAAKAKVTEAEAALEQARTSLAQATITSPIDGIVISRSVDPGQTVAASLSAPILFVIAGDLRDMEVHTSVAESDVGQLRPGMAVEFSVDAFPEKTFTGTVKQVRYEAQNVSNVISYDAVVSVRNEELLLRPGMTANATFVIAERAGVLTVPSKALRYQLPRALRPRREGGDDDKVPASTERGRRGGRGTRGDAVWVLRDGAPLRVRVETGLSDGTVTEITGGELAEGDLVITADSTVKAAPASGQNQGGGRGGRGGRGGPRGPF